MVDGCIVLRLRFAGVDALVPRVMTFCVTSSTSAVSKPRTAATATTTFAGFHDDAASGAYGIDGRRRGCWCLHVGISQRHIGQSQTEEKSYNRHCLLSIRMCLHTNSLKTYVCRSSRLQTTCDQRFFCRHLHTSETKNRQERNN